MDESRRNMFFIEGQILVQLNHKNITTLFGISPATREPMIITQYFNNGSVMRFFAKVKKNRYDMFQLKKGSVS